MNTTLNDDSLNPFFELSEEDELMQEARMIMYRFLSEIELHSKQEKGLRVYLAKIINKSKSFITQLFNGDKLINLLTLAKFQKALKIKFKIVAIPESDFYSTNVFPLLLFAKNYFVPSSLSDIISNSGLSLKEAPDKNQFAKVQTLKKSEPILS